MISFVLVISSYYFALCLHSWQDLEKNQFWIIIPVPAYKYINTLCMKTLFIKKIIL